MISALVLAAGLSRRMGSFKLLLPWGRHTVIEQVIETLASAGLSEVLVVTGYRASDVEGALSGWRVRTVMNPEYVDGDMLKSLQVGLSALENEPGVQAALLCLGDQPQMEDESIQAVLTAGAASDWQRVVIPSYQMHGGHPIVLPRILWPAILSGSGSLRAIIASEGIAPLYVTVANASILADLDTPEDYRRAQLPAGM